MLPMLCDAIPNPGHRGNSSVSQAALTSTVVNRYCPVLVCAAGSFKIRTICKRGGKFRPNWIEAQDSRLAFGPQRDSPINTSLTVLAGSAVTRRIT